MTFDEFIAKWEGSGIDFDGYYGDQCVDLYRQYVKEVIGAPQSPSVAGAKDIWNNYFKDHFKAIPNAPTNIPQKGDIVIWGNGQWGHVAIFISGGTMQMTTFDQNYPTGSLCAKRNHSYDGVIGWLRPIGIIEESTNMEITNSTKIDLAEHGVMEVQRIKGELTALREIEEKYKELLENPPVGGISDEQITALGDVLKKAVKVPFDLTNKKIQAVQTAVDLTETNLTGDREGLGTMQVNQAGMLEEMREFKMLLTKQTEKINAGVKATVEKAIMLVAGKVEASVKTALKSFIDKEPQIREKTVWERLTFWK